MAHNVLTAEDRYSFSADIADGDLDAADSWSSLVVYDLSSRCRSFTPVVLADLMALGKAAGEL